MGDYSETWTKDGLCWLRDSRLLPSKLPNARILSFGYNASLALTKSKADTHDIALDLLGGIIAKQALVIAHDDENEFSDLLNAVRGIAFLGVPNRGSQIASYADTLLSIICPGPGRMLMDPSLLCFLKAHSQQLQHLSDSAKWRLWNVPYIYSFYETEVTARMKVQSSKLLRNTLIKCIQIVVGKDSATIGLAHEKTIPVTADHGNICKFNASESKRYEAVSGHIQRMVNKIMDTSTQCG
ncbi:MAG: hypothetical protein LQ342_001227 [Letrouitia transgressa]|nr:MAG: hypothetical protein LQ342_001227 [Letrouitia transgressa]